MMTAAMAVLFFFSGASMAQGAEPVVEATYGGVTMGTIVETLLALVLVAVAIFASSWLIKRINPRIRQMSSGREIKVVSSFSLGSRERLVIVEVQEQRLLVGITSGSISLIKDLTSLPCSDVKENLPSSSDESLFRRLLKR